MCIYIYILYIHIWRYHRSVICATINTVIFPIGRWSSIGRVPAPGFPWEWLPPINPMFWSWLIHIVAIKETWVATHNKFIYIYIYCMHYICHLHGSCAIYMADLWNLIIHYPTVTVVTVVTVVSKQKRNEPSPSTVAHPIHRTPRWCDELRELAALVIIGVGRRGATGAPEPQDVAPTARPQPIGGSSHGSWLVSDLWLFVWYAIFYLEFDGFQVGKGMVPAKKI